MSRLSRLPVARTTLNKSDQDGVQQSHLPRPLADQYTKTSVKPLSEHDISGSRIAQRHSRILAPKKTVTTPDSSHSRDLENIPPIIEQADSGVTDQTVAPGNDGIGSRRRPRLSLSERTIETLAQVSPCPSPSRGRSDTTTSSGSMGPPALPTFAIKSPGSATPYKFSSVRSPSPTKRLARPSLPTATTSVSTGTVRSHSPTSRSKIGRLSTTSSRTASPALVNPPVSRPIPGRGPQVSKTKSMHNLRGTTPEPKGLKSKPSLKALNAKDSSTKPSAPAMPMPEHVQTHRNSLRPRQSMGNISQSSDHDTAPKRKTRPAQKQSVASASRTTSTPAAGQAQGNHKSSAALREAIAKAKAAKSSVTPDLTLDTLVANSPVDGDEMTPQAVTTEFGTASLRKKLEIAVTTGVLNLCAFNLKQLPDEVLSMYDFQPNSTVTWSEAVDLRKLLLADNEIEELSDAAFPDWSLEEMAHEEQKSNQFGGLEILDMHGNCLRSIPIGIRRLQHLRTLNLSKNLLSTNVFGIVSQLSNLKELRLMSNNIQDSIPIEVSNMVGLRVLDLSSNQIRQIPNLTTLAELQKLLLSGNRLSALDTSLLPQKSLLELDVSGNEIAGVLAGDLNGFEKLNTLNVSHNKLSHICPQSLALPHLHSLSVEFNRLTDLPDLSQCTNLTALSCAENQLPSLPASISSLTELRNIDLSMNNIKVVDRLVINMDNISTLNLAGNPLRDKKYLTMNIAEIRADMRRKYTPVGPDAIISPSRPTTSGTDYETASEGPTSFFRPHNGALDLSSLQLNGIIIDEIDLTFPIHTLRLSNNNLTHLPLDLLTHSSVQPSLRHLDLSYNTALDLTLNSDLDLPALQSINLSNTTLSSIKTLTVLSAPLLTELSVSHNRLAGPLSLPPHFPNLHTLLISDNRITSLDASAISGLEVLDISNNEVESLSPQIGLLGNKAGRTEKGKLRVFECKGNRFRVPRQLVVEKGTEAVLRDLRRMLREEEVPDEWRDEV